MPRGPDRSGMHEKEKPAPLILQGPFALWIKLSILRKPARMHESPYYNGYFMPDIDLSAVRALIFDLDGTLIDSQKDLILSVNAMLRELGRPELSDDTISSYIGQAVPVLVARVLGNGAASEEHKRGIEFFLGYYEVHKMDNTRPYHGVPAALASLRDYPMAAF